MYILFAVMFWFLASVAVVSADTQYWVAVSSECWQKMGPMRPPCSPPSMQPKNLPWMLALANAPNNTAQACLTSIRQFCTMPADSHTWSVNRQISYGSHRFTAMAQPLLLHDDPFCVHWPAIVSGCTPRSNCSSTLPSAPCQALNDGLVLLQGEPLGSLRIEQCLAQTAAVGNLVIWWTATPATSLVDFRQTVVIHGLGPDSVAGDRDEAQASDEAVLQALVQSCGLSESEALELAVYERRRLPGSVALYRVTLDQAWTCQAGLAAAGVTCMIHTESPQGLTTSLLDPNLQLNWFRVRLVLPPGAPRNVSDWCSGSWPSLCASASCWSLTGRETAPTGILDLGFRPDPAHIRICQDVTTQVNPPLPLFPPVYSFSVQAYSDPGDRQALTNALGQCLNTTIPVLSSSASATFQSDDVDRVRLCWRLAAPLVSNWSSSVFIPYSVVVLAPHSNSLVESIQCQQQCAPLVPIVRLQPGGVLFRASDPFLVQACQSDAASSIARLVPIPNDVPSAFSVSIVQDWQAHLTDQQWAMAYKLCVRANTSWQQAYWAASNSSTWLVHVTAEQASHCQRILSDWPLQVSVDPPLPSIYWYVLVVATRDLALVGLGSNAPVQQQCTNGTETGWSIASVWSIPMDAWAAFRQVQCLGVDAYMHVFDPTTQTLAQFVQAINHTQFDAPKPPTPPSPPPPPPTPDSASHKPWYLMSETSPLALILEGLACIIVLVLLVWCCRRYRQSKEDRLWGLPPAFWGDGGTIRPLPSLSIKTQVEMVSPNPTVKRWPNRYSKHRRRTPTVKSVVASQITEDSDDDTDVRDEDAQETTPDWEREEAKKAAMVVMASSGPKGETVSTLSSDGRYVLTFNGHDLVRQPVHGHHDVPLISPDTPTSDAESKAQPTSSIPAAPPMEVGMAPPPYPQDLHIDSSFGDEFQETVIMVT